MTLNGATSLLVARSFEVIPQVPDFEREDDWACYLHRVGPSVETWQGPKPVHEYVLLVAGREDHHLLEAVHERYLAPKNMRRPKSRATYTKHGDQTDPYSDLQYKGFYPVYATILRDKDISLLT